MSLKKGYYYLFYKFYNLAENSPAILPSDFIAACIISWLEIIFLVTFKFYYREFIDPNDTFIFLSFQTIVPLTIIFLIKYFAFIRDETWKKYVKEFDQLSEDENDKGTIIVGGIVMFIIGNLILATYLAPGHK